jgi:hypothetical protein
MAQEEVVVLVNLVVRYLQVDLVGLVVTEPLHLYLDHP